MNRTISLSKSPVGIIISVISLVFLVILGFVVSHAGATAATATVSGRLITIHDRGTQNVVLSTAATVGDALAEAGVSIDKSDTVEPAVDEKLVATEYQVNIYRARPVTIVDGTTKQTIVTPYQTASQIASSAGMTLFDEDRTTLTTSTDNIITEGASLRLTIDRATAFTFVLYGATTTAHTQAATVGDMLKQKGITLGESDRVSPDASTAVTADMSVRVWREGKQTITVQEPVAFATEKVQDGDREVGYKAIQTAGVAGSRSVTYEVLIQDGQETGRTEIASLVLTQPVKQVEIIGAKYQTFGGTCADWIAGAGITDVGTASELIRRESGCNPNAVNPSSGACGVGQALPCSKTGCQMGDGACQTIWMNSYVLGRYGSWSAALAHHNQVGWY